MRTTCNYCLRVGSGPSGGPLLACAGCKATVYCDAACQRAHWKAVHKAECKMFARVRANAGRDWLPTPTRAVAQVLLLLKAGDKAARAAFGEGGTLEGNVEAFRRDEAVWGDYELQAMAAVVYGGLLESEEMLATARAVLCKVGGLLVEGVGGVLLMGGQIQTNAFNRLDPDTGMAGIFLDAGLAMINHSCVPNAFIGFDKRTAMLRAERNIAEGDEIEISYIGTWVLRTMGFQLPSNSSQTTCSPSRCGRKVCGSITSSANVPGARMTLTSTTSAQRHQPSPSTLSVSAPICLGCETLPSTGPKRRAPSSRQSTRRAIPRRCQMAEKQPRNGGGRCAKRWRMPACGPSSRCRQPFFKRRRCVNRARRRGSMRCRCRAS